jgi:hypothetical protein
MSQPEFFDVKETAKRLGVSASHLNKLRVTGGGPPYAKFAKAVRYHWPTVKGWAEKQSHTSTSEYCEVA